MIFDLKKIIVDIVKKINIDKNKDMIRHTKYTLGQYVDEILYVMQNLKSWSAYRGIFNKKTLYNKHLQLSKNNVFKMAYKESLDIYLKKNKAYNLKYQSIDTSFVKNKLGCKINDNKIPRNKFYKNKRCIKISTIVDRNGIPLSLLTLPGNGNDFPTYRPTIDEYLICPKKDKTSNNNRWKQYFLADKGYDSKAIRDDLKEKGFIPIIDFNKRRKKNEDVQKLSDTEKVHYKKRIKVENFFAIAKANVKLDKLYEKNVDNYNSLLYLFAVKRISNYINNGF